MNKNILNYYYVSILDENNRYNSLKYFLDKCNNSKIIIYTTTKTIGNLYSKLRLMNYLVSIMYTKYHIKYTKKDFEEFTSNSTNILITDKFINKNIDIPKLSTIIFYDYFLENENFIINTNENNDNRLVNVIRFYKNEKEDKMIDELKSKYKNLIKLDMSFIDE